MGRITSNPQKLGRRKEKIFLQSLPRERGLAYVLLLDLWPPEPEPNKFLCVKPPSLCYCVTAVLGN